MQHALAPTQDIADNHKEIRYFHFTTFKCTLHVEETNIFQIPSILQKGDYYVVSHICGLPY